MSTFYREVLKILICKLCMIKKKDERDVKPVLCLGHIMCGDQQGNDIFLKKKQTNKEMI